MKPTDQPPEATALDAEADLELALSVLEAAIQRALAEAESADVPEWLKG